MVSRKEFRLGYMKMVSKKLINWKQGKQIGISKTWHHNGKLKSEFIFKYGLKNGLCQEWYENGSKKYDQIGLMEKEGLARLGIQMVIK